jgi:hypothetical protein
VVADYERLRSHAVAGCISGVRQGLAVMVQRGMAAWLEQRWQFGSLPEAKSSTRLGDEQRLPGEQCDELIDLLTNLALTRLKEATS